MSIKETLSKLMNRDQDLKELKRQIKIQKTVEQLQKNSNERELERYMEEDRQRRIKEKLHEYREERKVTHKSGNPLNVPNRFQEPDYEILKDKKLFSEHKDVLKQKYLFGRE